MVSYSRETFRFGDFALDVAGYQLRHNGRPVRLERQPMDLLILLVERRLQLVSRSEIVDRLWGKDVFVDVETGVHTAIRKIRQALHDSPEAPVFVETVSGKGYRFIAPVEVVPASPDPPAAQAPESAVPVPSSSVPIVTAAETVPPPPPAPPHRTRTGSALTFTQSWRGRLIAGVLAVALGGLVTWGWQRMRTAAAVSELEFKANFYRTKWSEAEIRKGIDYYNRAIALDPNALDAYGGLASAWIFLSDLHVSPRDAMPRARAAAEEVLRRDEASADAHVSLAVIELQSLGLRRRRPGVRAGDRARAGRHRRAIPARLAADGGGTTDRRAGRHAARRRRGPVERDEPLEPGPLVLFRAPIRGGNRAVSSGHRRGAAVVLGAPVARLGVRTSGPCGRRHRGARTGPATDRHAAGRRGARARAGRRRSPRRGAGHDDLAPRYAKRKDASPYDLATASAGLGDGTETLAWLEKAYEERSGWLALWLKIDPAFDSLRDDDRFRDLLTRVGHTP